MLGRWSQGQSKHGYLPHRYFCLRVKGEETIVKHLKIQHSVAAYWADPG